MVSRRWKRKERCSVLRDTCSERKSARGAYRSYTRRGLLCDVLLLCLIETEVSRPMMVIFVNRHVIHIADIFAEALTYFIQHAMELSVIAHLNAELDAAISDLLDVLADERVLPAKITERNLLRARVITLVHEHFELRTAESRLVHINAVARDDAVFFQALEAMLDDCRRGF